MIMRSIKAGTFYGRPASLCSGVTLHEKVSIKLRSDILIDRQKENVEIIERELERSILDLKHATNKRDIEIQMNDLKKSRDQMEIILQLVLKLNIELSHARFDLKRAFNNRSDQVNLARKRVVWLEERIKKILESHWKSEGKLLIDDESCNLFDLQMNSKNNSNRKDTIVLSDREKRSIRLLEAEKRSSNAKIRINDVNKKPVGSLEGQEFNQIDNQVDNHVHSKDFVQCSNLINDNKTEIECTVPSAMHTDSDKLKESNNAAKTKDETVKENLITTFITEVNLNTREKKEDTTLIQGQTLPEMQMIKTPPTIQTVSFYDDTLIRCESTVNHCKDYWNSEHHRFERSILEDINPTSYHQMALAVQGTFVSDVQTNPKLPWRERRISSDASEAQTKSLNQLSKRMNDMFSKLRNAALVSVNIGDDKLNLNNENEKKQLILSSSSAVSTGKIESDILFPVLLQNRPMTERLQVNPLTINKIERSKIYPRSSDNFSQSFPGEDSAAVRIVDQRNLLDETKFSSTLFRSKRGQHVRPVSVESHFRRMIDQDIKSSECVGNNASKEERTTENRIIENENLKMNALKWNRINEVIFENLKSDLEDNRVDAAKSLGAFKYDVHEPLIVKALLEIIKTDKNERVLFEATKSLALQGCWAEVVQDKMINFLLVGGVHLQNELLRSMIKGSKTCYSVDKEVEMFSDLCDTLSDLCENDDVDDKVSSSAALCLSSLCVFVNASAEKKLRNILQHSKDPHTQAQALEASFHLLNKLDDDLISAALVQLKKSSLWKYRRDAAQHLTALGLKYKMPGKILDKIYIPLKTALWDDVDMVVRLEAGKALTACGLIQRTCEEVNNQLRDSSDSIRAEAVISVGTLGMKSERILKILLNLVQLDPSQTVQQMVIRTFVLLKCTDEPVLNILKNKSLMEGIVAREAEKAYTLLSRMSC